MLKLIHKRGAHGKYYTALTTTDTKTNLCFDPVHVRLALTLAGDKACDLTRELNLPHVVSLLKVEQPWELVI